MNEPAYFDVINGAAMWGTVLLQAVVVILALALFRVRGFSRVRTFVNEYGLTLSILLIFGSALGSYYYSLVALFEPCVLCWYQRIFLFPQLPLLVMALMRKTRDIVPYTIMLSIIGAAIAVYQIILERIPILAAICEPGAASVSCTTIYIEGFNYITIPVMGLTVFALLLLIGLIMHVSERESRHSIV